MGERPGPEYSIERKDGNGNYEPSNCKWATLTEQNRNRCNTRLLTVGGVTKPLVQWAEENGLQANTLEQRVSRGWAEKDLFSPKRQGHGIACSINPCTCRRKKFSKEEVWQSLLKRWAGRTVTIKQIQNRLLIPQAEIVKLCKGLGLTIHPDPALKSYPRFGRQTVQL